MTAMLTREEIAALTGFSYSTVKRWPLRYKDFPRVYVGDKNRHEIIATQFRDWFAKHQYEILRGL